MVKARGLIEDIGVFREHDETVGKAFGNPEAVEFFCVEVNANPAAKLRGVRSDINRNVPDVSGQNAHQLPLRLLELVVETAENPLSGEGLIVLNKQSWDTGGGEVVGIEDFREPTAIVAVLLEVNSFYIAQRCWTYLHGSF